MISPYPCSALLKMLPADSCRLIFARFFARTRMHQYPCIRERALGPDQLAMVHFGRPNVQAGARARAPA